MKERVMRNAKVIILFTLVSLTNLSVIKATDAGSIASWGAIAFDTKELDANDIIGHFPYDLARLRRRTMLDPFSLCRVLACILRFSKDVRYPSHAYFSRN